MLKLFPFAEGVYLPLETKPPFSNKALATFI
jgi:hypothetical protein